MKGIFCEELRRAFRNPRWGLVLALCLAALGAGVYRFAAITGDQPPIHPVNLLINVLTYTPFSLLAALLATLPFADSLIEDRAHGFLRCLALRAPYRRYLAAKALAVGLAGGAAVSLSLLLMQVLLALCVPVNPANTAFVSLSTLAPRQPWGPFGELYLTNPYAYLAYLVGSSFLFGAAYALLGLAVSALVDNRYVALAAPWLVCQGLSFLEERSLRLPPAWNPTYALVPFNAYNGFYLTNQLVQFAGLLSIAAVGLLVFARRQRMLGG